MYHSYHSFADFYLNSRKVPVTRTLISFTKSVKFEVLYKSFFERFPK